MLLLVSVAELALLGAFRKTAPELLGVTLPSGKLAAPWMVQFEFS